MPRKPAAPKRAPSKRAAPPAQAPPAGRPSALVDTRIIYCGDCLYQLRKLPDHCVDLIYIDPPFNSNRNYEVFWGETKEKRAFEDRHASTAAYIDYMRPRCIELARVLKPTGSFYYHCDWHAPAHVWRRERLWIGARRSESDREGDRNAERRSVDHRTSRRSPQVPPIGYRRCPGPHSATAER